MNLRRRNRRTRTRKKRGMPGTWIRSGERLRQVRQGGGVGVGVGKRRRREKGEEDGRIKTLENFTLLISSVACVFISAHLLTAQLHLQTLAVATKKKGLGGVTIIFFSRKIQNRFVHPLL
jgi:hypothetical protein